MGGAVSLSAVTGVFFVDMFRQLSVAVVGCVLTFTELLCLSGVYVIVMSCLTHQVDACLVACSDEQ